jgi:hypothetical protein
VCVKLPIQLACYAKDTLQSHSQMTHLDSSSLSPTTSAGTRNRPLLPHFEHLLASLQVRKLIFIIISNLSSLTVVGWIKIIYINFIFVFHSFCNFFIFTIALYITGGIIVLVFSHHHFHLFYLNHILSLTYSLSPSK